MFDPSQFLSLLAYSLRCASSSCLPRVPLPLWGDSGPVVQIEPYEGSTGQRLGENIASQLSDRRYRNGRCW
jgi:hypothetical protein